MRWLLLLLVLATDPPAPAEEVGAKAIFRNPSLDVLTIPSQAQEAKPRRKEPDGRAQPRPVPPGKSGVRSPGPAKAEPVRSIGIRSWIRRIDGQGKVLAELSAGHIFRSGERIQLVVESNAEAYLAVVQQGSDGRTGLLFPTHESGLGADRIPPHTKVILPGPRHAFTFDEQAGTERLLIVLVRDRRELAELPLRREMRPEDLEALRKVAARERGAKNLIIEALADSGEDPATYTVNRAGSAIVQEFALVHEK